MTWVANDKRILTHENNIFLLSQIILGISLDKIHNSAKIVQAIKTITSYSLKTNIFLTQNNIETEIIRNIIIETGKLNPQIQHLYTYGINNSINFTDPNGEMLFSAGFIVASAWFCLAAMAMQLMNYAAYALKCPLHSDEPEPDWNGPAEDPVKIPEPPRVIHPATK
jgi:hypothetical protein